MNNLYGVQIGVDGKILEFGRFSLDGLIKIGLFDDNAEQSTGVSMQKTVYPSSATANHAAFASEGGLQLKYQVHRGAGRKGRLRSAMARRRCLGAGTDPGNGYGSVDCDVHLASTAGQVCFFKALLPDWNIRFRRGCRCK